MTTPYVGEIRLFAGNFAPVGWLLCQGQTLSIAENTALFNLIGTTYGGDGQSTFALPDLTGRIPFDQGPGYQPGQFGGAEQVRLSFGNLPAHTHQASCNGKGADQGKPDGTVWGAGTLQGYTAAKPTAAMSPASLTPAGGGQPHDNMPPFLALNFIIAVEGVFPPHN